jgi:hypothetical protein
MLAIVASRHDATARMLADAWSHLDAALLTATDLSTPGWRYEIPAGPQECAVVDGRRVPRGEISGVLIRLPCVTADELGHVAAEDRAYVATEMTAFLAAWLSNLACPVLNRPTINCLSGPAWRNEQWLHLSARIGIPTVEWELDTELPVCGAPAGSSVTVLGNRCFGEVHGTLQDHACSLARAAGVELLEVRFTGPDADAPLRAVSLWPDLTPPEVCDAIGQYFSGARPC